MRKREVRVTDGYEDAENTKQFLYKSNLIVRINNSDRTNELPNDNWRFHGKLRSVIGEKKQAIRNDLGSSKPVPRIVSRSKGKATTCRDSWSIIPNTSVFPWDFFAKVKFICELRQIAIYFRAASRRFHTRENIFHKTRERESRRLMENRHSRRFLWYPNATQLFSNAGNGELFSACVYVLITIYLKFATFHFAWLLSATAIRLYSMYVCTCTMITHISEKMCVAKIACIHAMKLGTIRYLQASVVWMEIILFLVNQLSIYFYFALELQWKSGIIQFA
jgi:hypothetical protein